MSLRTYSCSRTNSWTLVDSTAPLTTARADASEASSSPVSRVKIAVLLTVSYRHTASSLATDQLWLVHPVVRHPHVSQDAVGTDSTRSLTIGAADASEASSSPVSRVKFVVLFTVT